MNRNHNTFVALLVAATLAGSLVACNQSSSDANAEKIAELTKQAEDTQKALDQAQAEKAALEQQQAEAAEKAQQEQLAKEKADADAKVAAAEAKATAAKKEAAAARRRAAQQASASSTSTYVEPRATTPAPVCQDCGTVAGVTPVTVQGEGTGMGAVAGAVAGAVVGHQIGRGSGNKVAEALGALAGGFGGNAAEKRIRSTTVYDVTVRMDAGGSRTVRVGDPAGISSGERVRVEGNNLVRI